MRRESQLYVIEERSKYTGGEWAPNIWGCRPTRAWARRNKAEADKGTDPKVATKRRICIYRRISVVR